MQSCSMISRRHPGCVDSHYPALSSFFTWWFNDRKPCFVGSEPQSGSTLQGGLWALGSSATPYARGWSRGVDAAPDAPTGGSTGDGRMLKYTPAAPALLPSLPSYFVASEHPMASFLCTPSHTHTSLSPRAPGWQETMKVVILSGGFGAQLTHDIVQAGPC